MKHEIKLIRVISYGENDRYIEGVPPQRLEITLDGDINLPDLLQQFEQFVKGMSYVPPEGAHLDYVSDDEDSRCCGECDCQHP